MNTARHPAVALALALAVTLGMLGGVDHLAAHSSSPTPAAVTLANAAPLQTVVIVGQRVQRS